MTPSETRACSRRKKSGKVPKHSLTPRERFMIPNPQWQEGYEAFSGLFGKPIGWLILLDEHERHRLIRLDRKQNCPYFFKSGENQRQCEAFITKFVDQLIHNEEMIERLPLFYRCASAKPCLAFPVRYLGSLKGFLLIVSRSRREVKELSTLFSFLSTHVELAYKNFELNNFYETVHPGLWLFQPCIPSIA